MGLMGMSWAFELVYMEMKNTEWESERAGEKKYDVKLSIFERIKIACFYGQWTEIAHSRALFLLNHSEMKKKYGFVWPCNGPM